MTTTKTNRNMIEMHLKITVGITDALAAALSRLAGGGAPGDTQPAPAPAPARKKKNAKEAVTAVAEAPAEDSSTAMPFDAETAPEAPKTEASENMTEANPEPAPAAQPEAPAAPASAEGERKSYPGWTDELLRDHMDNVFKRIIGYDWQQRVTEDAGAKSLQRQITKTFKQIAAGFGAMKPTAIAQSQRPAFCDALHNITLGDDGTIVNLPF